MGVQPVPFRRMLFCGVREVCVFITLPVTACPDRKILMPRRALTNRLPAMANAAFPDSVTDKTAGGASYLQLLNDAKHTERTNEDVEFICVVRCGGGHDSAR